MSSDEQPTKVVKERSSEETLKKKFSEMDLAMIARVNRNAEGEPVLTDDQLHALASGTYDARTFYWGTRLAKLGFREKQRVEDQQSKFLRGPVKNRSEVLQMIFEASEKYITPDLKATMRYLHILTEVLKMKGIDITDADFTAARDKLDAEAKEQAEKMIAEMRKSEEQAEKPEGEEAAPQAGGQ